MLGQFLRSLGLELSGAKQDRSAVATMDFYPTTNRLILVDIEVLHTPPESEASADAYLIESIERLIAEAPQFTGIAVHAPLTLPPMLYTCLQKDGESGAKVPHAEASSDPQVRWMLQTWKSLNPQPRPFVPYLQRPAEIWLRYVCTEKFDIPEGLGANTAPFAARMQFLQHHLPKPLNEVFPKATLSRLISSLGMPKNLVRLYRDIDRGLHTREAFFEQLTKRLPQLFIYERDLEKMIVHLNCFHAFLSALTQHLWVKKQTERPPRGFPRGAAWIHIPVAGIDWPAVFSE